MKLKTTFSLLCLSSLALQSCGGKNSSSAANLDTYTLKGALPSTHVSALSGHGIGPMTVKTVTHIMAINPESSNPTRYLTAVGSDGSFSLKVNPNRPYVLVFIDNSLVGKNMIVGIFKAQTLDSVAPIGTNGTTDLGNLSIASSVATSDVAYNTLLARMGLNSADALALGAVDDLSLRYANPDIDGNGVIDVLENKTFGLDFHVRSLMRKGDGTHLMVDDVLNHFADDSGSVVELANFNLSSIYALYPSSFDSTTCVASNALTGGCTYNSSVSATVSSYSGLGFGVMNGFGADYSHPTTEMPGSAGTPTDITFGFNGHTLTYSNVVTRTSTQLQASGTIIPFVQLVTTGGFISEIKYKWMKKTSSTTWTAATENEVKLIVNDDGGFYGLYINTNHASSTRAQHVSFKISRTPTGSVPFTLAASAGDSNMTATEIATTVPDDICNGAFSYDDKLGLRIFAGAPEANASRTMCP